MSYDIRCKVCDGLLAQIDVGRHKPMSAYCPVCDPAKNVDSPRNPFGYSNAEHFDVPDFMKGLFK